MKMKHGKQNDHRTDAAEWCNVLAAKKTVIAIDENADTRDRLTANHERIILWEAAILLQREASNEKLTDCRREQP